MSPRLIEVAERFKIRHALPAARWPTAEEAARARWFQRARIGRLDVAERTWVPAMVPWRASADGVVTPQVLDSIRWEAFWDSPLNVPGDTVAHGGATPPLDGVADQPGMPRKPEEITRAAANYRVTSCDVKTNGARLEISFPGVTLGVFEDPEGHVIGLVEAKTA